MSILSVLAELGTYGLGLYWTALYFGLEINWEKKQFESKTGESGCGAGREQQGGALALWITASGPFFHPWLGG